MTAKSLAQQVQSLGFELQHCINPGLVVQSCDPRNWEREAECSKVKWQPQTTYLVWVQPGLLRKTSSSREERGKAGHGLHTCNLSTWEVETRGLGVQGCHYCLSSGWSGLIEFLPAKTKTTSQKLSTRITRAVTQKSLTEFDISFLSASHL